MDIYRLPYDRYFMNEPSDTDRVLYARVDDDTILVRIIGRGNHELSHTFKSLVDSANTDTTSVHYIIDLSQCTCLDSTFMGTMAAMALHQTAVRGDRPVVVNANATTERQLTTLGLNYLLDVCHESTEVPADNKEMKAVEGKCDIDQYERITHMIEAHETLIDADSGNEVKFRGVLDALNQSLDNEEPSSA
ncbi:MAG: STAS domain-containing protein [Candidatus Sumerlaeota bacterium]